MLRPVTDPVPQPWLALTKTLTSQPDSPLAGALTSPLDVTLLRDIYTPGLAVPGLGNVDELLDTDRFPDATSITRHLRDYTVPAAYAPRPGQRTPYAEGTPHRTLALIARRLGSRDLAWWTIATWLPGPLRIVISCVAGMVVAGSCYGLASLAVSGGRTWPLVWLEIAFWFALILGMPASLAVTPAFTLTAGRKDAGPPYRALVRMCVMVVFGAALSLLPGVILGGWSLSLSTFGFAFAVVYGISARTRGAAMLKSLSIRAGLGSARRLGSALLLGLLFGAADGLFGLLAYLIQGGGVVPAVEYGITGVVACLLIITPTAWLTGAFTDGPTSGRTDSADPVRAWRGGTTSGCGLSSASRSGWPAGSTAGSCTTHPSTGWPAVVPAAGSRTRSPAAWRWGSPAA
ncbi:hypothetical protein [Fodinicola feengrottensis]|uniref:hypothetical protein n=1 Tax=Fodinicola feengrottensis TaxID=435914 RepID=UPI0013D45469|nr:hypothetical protein [Fodinicola feengrottensis]